MRIQWSLSANVSVDVERVAVVTCLQELPSRQDLPVRGLEVITVLSIAIAEYSAYCVAWSINS